MNQYEKFSDFPSSKCEYSLAERIVYEIINNFYSRKGFDDFWDDVDDDILNELIDDQVKMVSSIIEEHDK